MAASVTSAAGGRHRRRRRAVMSEINVTPFVDIMLVLLIVFMVSAPLMVNSMSADLPKAGAGKSVKTVKQITLKVAKSISATACGQFVLTLAPTQDQDGKPVDLDKLETAVQSLKDASTAPLDANVRVLGDADVCYADIIALMHSLEHAGFGTDFLYNPQ